MLIILGTILYFNLSELAITNVPFLWRGLDGEATFSGSVVGGGINQCSSGNGYVSGYNTNETVNIKSNSYGGQCSAPESSSASAKFFIKNPEKLKTIYIDLSGSASGMDKCPGSASVSLSQLNNWLFSARHEVNSEGISSGQIPQGILVTFSDGYGTVPALQSSFKLEGNDPLTLRFSTSANAMQGSRSCSGTIFVKEIEVNRIEENEEEPIDEQNNTAWYIGGGIIGGLGLLGFIFRKKIFGVWIK